MAEETKDDKKTFTTPTSDNLKIHLSQHARKKRKTVGDQA